MGVISRPVIRLFRKDAHGIRLEELTEFAVDAVIASSALAEETIEQGEADPVALAGIRVARTGKTVVYLGVVLRHVNRQVLVSFVVYHETLYSTAEACRCPGHPMHLAPVSKQSYNY